ncbi:MAG: GcrA cell cycle regulator [Caulobacterales bacterium]|nr:GcrA cell cycle regulator [Caulobacterales bacterium]
MTASAWTEDRVGRLKTLWHEGQTAEQIARDLANGITRCAVLGKVYRMGLSAGRPTASAKAARRAPTTAPPSRARPPVSPRPCIGPEPMPEKGVATLLSVRRHQCRWPLGDPLAASFSLCGREVAKGAYCASHAQIAYRPGRETPQSLERLARLNG